MYIKIQALFKKATKDSNDAWNGVVSIVSYRKGEDRDSGTIATGSGFLVAPDLVVTAAHVFTADDTKDFLPPNSIGFLNQSNNQVQVGIDQYWIDKNCDVAIVKLKRPLSQYYIPVANQEQVDSGHVSIYDTRFDVNSSRRLQYEYNMQRTVEEASVPKKRCTGHAKCQKPIFAGTPHHSYFFVAGSGPGNSGAPILNEKGEVITIITNIVLPVTTEFDKIRNKKCGIRGFEKHITGPSNTDFKRALIQAETAFRKNNGLRLEAA